VKKSRLLIAPVFILHEGCPYRCVFCNQVDITGYNAQVDEQNVLDVLKTYLKPTINSNRFVRRELAFYGGSFTGLPDSRQEFLLSLIQPFIKNGQLDAIRVSTHPKFVGHSQLKRLKDYGVKTVELGVQSTSHAVLQESGRPCSIKEILKAVSLIGKYNFQLGLQLMLGLPGDNEKRFESSVADVIKMKPDFVRLYPALILRHTAMYSMYKKGLYVPWSLNRTLDALKGSIKSFGHAGIPVVRVGLQPDSSLKENFVAGPFHPSLRYLVDCKIGFEFMVEKILSMGQIPKRILFKVPIKLISIYIGNKRENLKLLKKRFKLDEVRLYGDEKCHQLELVA